MCGITGSISEFENGFAHDEMAVFQQNMVINQFRGSDSTGIFSVNRKGETSVIKRVGGVASIATDPEWTRMKQAALESGSILIGHGRAATRGHITEQNAHPFVHEEDGKKIIMVHNGTLELFQSLPRFHEFDVDSDWLAHCICKFGAEETFSKVRGAMAVVWWDSKEKTINFFRNSDRPLHFSTVRAPFKGAHTMMINSEAAALRYLIDRNSLKPKGKDDVYYFTPMTHFWLSLDDLSGGLKKKQITAAPEPVRHRTYYGGAEYDKTWWENYREKYNRINGEENKPSVHTDTMEREYFEDIQGLIDGRFSRIKWRHTGYKDVIFPGGGMITYARPPYEKGLIEMSLSREHGVTDGMVELLYSVGGNSWKILRGKDVPYNGIKLDTKKEELSQQQQQKGGKSADVDEFVAVGLKRFRPGRNFKFQTTHRNNVTKHSGKFLITEDAKHGRLQSYTNDLDGEICEGMEVLLEVVDYENIGFSGAWRMKANRLQIQSDAAVQDSYADFIWIVADEAQALATEKQGYFKGTIDIIRLATQDEHRESGAYVTCLVKDLVPQSYEDFVGTDSETKNEETSAAC